MWATLAYILACIQARFHIYPGSAFAMSRAPQCVIKKTKPNTAMNENWGVKYILYVFVAPEAP